MTLTNGRPNLPPMFASVLDAEDAKRERHVAEDASALDREAGELRQIRSRHGSDHGVRADGFRPRVGPDP
jgi:hypothetical protein